MIDELVTVEKRLVGKQYKFTLTKLRGECKHSVYKLECFDAMTGRYAYMGELKAHNRANNKKLFELACEMLSKMGA